MSGPAIGVRRATTVDAARIADVLAEAFADSSWTRWTIDARDHAGRVRALQLLALEHGGLPFGAVWVAEVDGRIEAAAVWMDGASPPPEAAWLAMGADQAELEGDRHQASVAAEAIQAPLRPTTPHRLLATVGTSLAVRRRGLGRAVLQPGLVGADQDGVPAFLETSTLDNVGFYESLGFGVTARTSIPGGPPVWIMVRPPEPGPEGGSGLSV